MGTLAYLSPEQALGQEVDQRCDPQTTLARGHLAVVQERSARMGEGVVAGSRVASPDLP